ncbi:MAG TPA: c-type cytochrome [Solirubrobacteraceae bacterium]|jgi:mono/diheme cytochrome c family protein|nr:c-type cytochrome [Solirubrobacteraceae bacterium]
MFARWKPQSRPAATLVVAAVKPLAALGALLVTAVALGACGTQGIQLSSSSPYHKGAELFLQRCSGCHTLATVGAEGSAVSIKDRVRTNGPNFDFRKEQYNQVLYAIRNGGFSGAIMPQNIVVGQQAKEVAAFLAKYAGLQAPKVPSIENTAIPGSAESATTATTGAATPTASTGSATSATAPATVSAKPTPGKRTGK